MRVAFRPFRILILLATVLVVGALPGLAQSNLGEVQIYVFTEQGLPFEGVSVEVNGDVYRSDVSGLIDFVHPPGTHVFTLVGPGGNPIGRVEIAVRQAQATEVIITASPANELQRSQTDVDAERRAIEGEGREALDTDGPVGTLVGVVTAVETGEPVAGATVIFRGVDFETTTDDDGRFTAELPAGEYSFSIIHPDFSTQTRDGVVIEAETETALDVGLTPAAIRLEEVPVFASEEVIVQGGIANLIEETRNSGVVVNLIGQEQISRTGDSDAAGALARVTGLTVLGGRFVYVRGMGERYSTSLLNDARLPSPEPDRRVVPLDLFPADVIESISVQKSYSPEVPGDFGGGAISIRSAGIPDDRYDRRLRVNVGASVAYNQGTTFTERLTEGVGAVDFLGFDDGTRRLPEDIANEDFVQPQSGGIGGGGDLTQDEVNALGRQIPNNWAPVVRTVPVDVGANASVRDKVNLANGGSIGFNVAALYSHGFAYAEGRQASYSAGVDGLTVENEYTTSSMVEDADIGFLGDFVFTNNAGFEVESTTLVLRATESSLDEFIGPATTEGRDIRLRQSIWSERMVVSQGLATELEFDRLNQTIMDARYVFSIAQRYEPDSRYSFYEDEVAFGEYDPATARPSRDTGGHQRNWTTVLDLIHDAEVAFEVPVFLFRRAVPDFIDVGVYGMYQTRGTDIRRFNYPVETGPADPLLEEEPGVVFDPANIGDEIGFEEGTFPEDNYAATHIIGAAYLTGDILLPFDVRLNAGSRVEYSLQTVETFDRFDRDPFTNEPRPITVQLATLDPLPAVNFTIPVLGNSQIRLGGSRTINRPDLRELAPTPFYGVPGFPAFNGNPNLTKATLWHADLRWETYLTQFESFSIAAFYKNFQNPIEVVAVRTSEFLQYPVNIPAAYNLGVELEWALQFNAASNLMRSLIRSLDFDSLQRELRWRRGLGVVSTFFRDLRTTGNVAIVQSRVNYAGQALEVPSGAAVANTNESRPLQGQAPYVVNVALGYRNEVSFSVDTPIHTSVFLNYNVVGPFITSIGIEGADDYYQQPFHELNLVYRQQIGYILRLGVEVGNILDPVARETVGLAVGDDNIVDEGRRGRTVSISVSLDL